MLLEKAPGILSREDIQGDVWGSDVNVDVEQSLNFCIRQIRIALIDGSKEPRYIETVPRLGYRFIAPVLREDVIAENLTLFDSRPVVPDEGAKAALDALPLPIQPLPLRKWLSMSAVAIAAFRRGRRRRSNGRPCEETVAIPSGSRT